jgi:hypothetical protein
MSIGEEDDDVVDVEVTDENQPGDDDNIEIVDDTPEKDRGRPPLPDHARAEPPDDDELAQYGEKVQKRFRQMSHTYHEERRGKEAAQRQLEQSANLNILQQRKIADLMRQLDERSKAMDESEETSYTQQLADAQKSFQTAFDAGDSEAMTAASAQIARATAALERLKVMKTMRPQPQPMPPQHYPQFAQQRQPMPQQPQQPQQHPPELVAWTQANPWFGRDQQMTEEALKIDQQMQARGEAIGTPEYYKKLDSEMRRMFPSYYGQWGDEPPRRVQTPGSVVAPASRGGGNKPRTRITLTASEVALAERMGLTPQQYAAEKKALGGAS